MQVGAWVGGLRSDSLRKLFWGAKQLSLSEAKTEPADTGSRKEVYPLQLAISWERKKPINIRWIQEGFKGGFLQKHLKPIRGPFLGDSVQILGCISDFWSVTPTFGLYL